MTDEVNYQKMPNQDLKNNMRKWIREADNEKKIFSEQPVKKFASKIVDNHYQKNKGKTPLTHVAENARDILGFKYNSTTGTFRNSDGRTAKDMGEAIKINDALEKNFQDHKEDDYIAQLKHFGNIHSQKKVSGYPRAAPKPSLANVPILNRNINNKKPKPQNSNPTIERYKQFKEDQKFKAEEKKFNEDFEKEYGEQAIKNYVRAKVNKNKREGKAPYENMSTSDIIVGEFAKEDAKKKLAAITTEHKKIEPNYIDYRMSFKDPEPRISLEEHIALKVPTEIDPLGITGLAEVKNFKNIIDITDQKFPTKARGIGPFISGEDN